MKSYSLDSSIIIDYLKGEIPENTLEMKNGRFLLPSIVELEVKWGEKDIKQFNELQTIKFGSEEVKEAINIKEYLKSRGEMINRLDIMIAAQTVTSGTTLITADKDFHKLEEYENFSYKTVSLD
jgi:predicted nucleic acid-binding protein